MAALPAKMRAIVYGEGGKPTMCQVAVPALQSHHLIVRVEAAGLNPVDYKLWQLTGCMAQLLFKGKAMAQDFAGTVAAVNPGSAFKVGDRVFGSSKTGSLAEFCLAEEGATAVLLANVPMADAASFPVAALTALQQLRGFEAGQSACVIGASGGVGTAAVQLAKALGASRVVAVCSAANADFVKSLGADEVVDYAIGDAALVAALKARPFHRVVDTVTSPKDKDYGPIAAACLTPTGSSVAINGGGGAMMSAVLYNGTGIQLQSARARTIMCVPNTKELTQLGALAAEGKLKAVLADTVAMDEDAVADAYKRLEGRRVKGKLVVRITA